LSVRVQLPRNSFLAKLDARQVVKTLILAAAVLAFLCVAALGFFYHKYAKLSDQKLLAGPFPNTALLYAAPVQVGIADPGSPAEIAAMLRKAATGRMSARTVRAGSIFDPTRSRYSRGPTRISKPSRE